jgi:hypothetical protein
MAPGEIVDWAKAIAVCGGVIGGLFAVYSVSWVWLKHHRFHALGGTMMCVFGTLLVIGPLFSRVSFVSDGKRMEFKFGELERELSRTITALEDTNKKYGELTASLQRMNITPSQVTKLQQDIDQLVTKVNQANAQVNQVNAVSQTALERFRIITNAPPGLEGKPPSPQTAPYVPPQQPDNLFQPFIPGR